MRSTNKPRRAGAVVLTAMLSALGVVVVEWWSGGFGGGLVALVGRKVGEVHLWLWFPAARSRLARSLEPRDGSS